MALWECMLLVLLPPASSAYPHCHCLAVLVTDSYHTRGADLSLGLIYCLFEASFVCSDSAVKVALLGIYKHMFLSGSS